jgi:hypothetical protein
MHWKARSASCSIRSPTTNARTTFDTAATRYAKVKSALDNILDSFARQTSVPNRQLYVGVYLPDFLASEDALCSPIFADHRQAGIPMLPEHTLCLPPRPERPAINLRKLFASPVAA